MINKLCNLVIEVKEKETISVDGPAQFTIVKCIKNDNRKRSLISIRAHKDVSIKVIKDEEITNKY